VLTESIVAFLLIGICLAIHCAGMVLLGIPLVNRRRAIEQRAGTVYIVLLLMGVFAVLLLLHLVENCIWAAFYYWRSLFENYETSLYFSFGTYTTIGYGDVVLPGKWRLLGALEGISGVLLCGLSTAFLFRVVDVLFQFRLQRIKRETDLPDAPKLRTDSLKD
jgi:hypothetical protein